MSRGLKGLTFLVVVSLIGWGVVAGTRPEGEPPFEGIWIEDFGHERVQFSLTDTLPFVMFVGQAVGSIDPLETPRFGTSQYGHTQKIVIHEVVFDRVPDWNSHIDSYMTEDHVAPEVGDVLKFVIEIDGSTDISNGDWLVAYVRPWSRQDPQWRAILGHLDGDSVTFIGPDRHLHTTELARVTQTFGISDVDAMRELGLDVGDLHRLIKRRRGVDRIYWKAAAQIEE